MDHVVIPLDEDHRRSLALLRRRIAAANGAGGHITLVAYHGLERAAAREAVEHAAARFGPLFVRAHGYGFFVGEEGDASLHVPVVREDGLNTLHAAVSSALREAGATLAGRSEPDLWSPHITLTSCGLDSGAVARAVAVLAARHHPSWRMRADRLEILGGRGETPGDAQSVPLVGGLMDAAPTSTAS